MRNIHNIAQLPTMIKGEFRNGIHESCFRAGGILVFVKELLEKNVDSDIILGLIDQIENHPGVTKDENGQKVEELATKEEV